MLCVVGVILDIVAVLKYQSIVVFPAVHRKTNFFENVYQDNTYSDSDFPVESLRLILFSPPPPPPTKSQSVTSCF